MSASVRAVRAVRVRVPFRVPLVTASRTWLARDSWLLRLEDADGRAGWGEAVLEDERDAPVLEALLEELAASGLPPAPALVSRAGAAGRAFRSAFDGASLDAGSRDGVPGGPRPAPPGDGSGVGVNAVIGAVDAVAAAEAAAAAVAAGYRTLKCKAGPGDTTATLLERVAAVRAAAGDAVAIRLDVNGTWDLETAAERLRVLAGLELAYAEQPLAPGDLAGAAALRSRAGVPIAADEAVDSVAAARAVLDARAADILVVKPGRVGGPAATEAIARLAAERGVPVVVSSLFETAIGLAAALACAAGLTDVPGWPATGRDHGLATAQLLDDDLVLAPLVIREGRMRTPGGPRSGALGITADEAAIERYSVGRA